MLLQGSDRQRGVSRGRLAPALCALLLALPAGVLRAVEITLVSTAGGRAEARAVTLEPLSLSELGRDAERAMSLPGSAEARREGGGLQADVPGLSVSALSEFVERELPVRWQVRLAPDQSPADLRVEAEWASPQGEPGRASIDSAPTSGPAIRVVVEGPWLLTSDDRGQVLEGAVRLRIPVALLTRSGALEGRLNMQAYLP